MDVLGALYSKRGLRFGGFRTELFLTATEELEARKPGTREQIIAEAHHQACWFWRLPEIVFVVVILSTHSPVLAILGFLAGNIYALLRFYLFGGSLLIAYVSQLWGWILLPLMFGIAYWLWAESPVASITMFIFAIVQGCFNLAHMLFAVAIRAPILFLIVRSKWGRRHIDRFGGLFSPEAFVMNTVIGKYRGDF